jgi:hypothetical protein
MLLQPTWKLILPLLIIRVKDQAPSDLFFFIATLSRLLTTTFKATSSQYSVASHGLDFHRPGLIVLAKAVGRARVRL